MCVVTFVITWTLAVPLTAAAAHVQPSITCVWEPAGSSTTLQLSHQLVYLSLHLLLLSSLSLALKDKT